jgi:hypothetical protein
VALLPLENHQVTSIQNDILDGLSSSTAMKGPCRVATTANIALTGLQTVDVVALAVNDRVLVKNQTTPSENGIWVVDTGPWRRSKDFDKTRDVRKGTRVTVTDGTANAGRDYIVTANNPISVGVTSLTIVEALSSDAGGSAAAAAISAAAALSSQGAAATSASAASTSASAAATSASGASTSATNAATSASGAATSATNAGNSATAASGSATAASGSATAASGSATAAAGSAVAAAASASAINLPSPAANTLLVRNAGNTAYDAKPFADVRDLLDASLYVADRTALKAIDTTKETVAILREAGREGVFFWRSGNFSTQVATDSQEGIYVKATAIAASAGAWVRDYDAAKNVDWFGADPTGVADSAAAFQCAAALGGDTLVPPSPYRLNTTISITLSNTRFIASGRGSSVITTYSTGHGFSVATGLSYIEFRDFSLLRNGTPGSNAQNGIHFAGLTERARVSRVEAIGHWHNFRMAATSLSKIDDNFSDNAYGNGYYVTNEDAVAAGLQWEVITCFAQRSNDHGIKYFSNFGTSAVVGPLVDFWSYANKLGGIIYQGTAGKPINGVRVLGGFSGEEGGDSLYMDTYGTTECHVIGLETEINGTSAVGVNQGTAAPHVGRGVTITANNTAAMLSGVLALGHSYSGIVTSCPRAIISGCAARGNGVAVAAAEQVGIYLLAGRAVVTGCSALGHSTATGFGIYVTADNGHTIVGNDVSESNTTPIGAGATLTNSILENNYGSTYEQAGTTPTPTSGTGSFTSASATLKYMKSGKRVDFTATVIITTNGTAAGYVSIPLPFAAEARSVCCMAFDETAVLGLTGYISSSASAVRIYTNTGTYPGATGKTLMVSGHYWVA